VIVEPRLDAVTAEQMRPVFETNLFGAASVITAVLPLLARSAHPRIVNVSSNPRTLLIDTVQGTTDRSSSCFIHYTTRVVRQTSRRISIEMLAPETKGRSFSCAAVAVRGPFFVPVHLSLDPRKRGTTGMKEGNGRVLHRRSSESRWPCPCVGDP